MGCSGAPLTCCGTWRSKSEPEAQEQTLGDDILVHRALSLKDHGVAVLVDPERVHPAAVLFAGRVLAGQALDTEQRLHVVLDQRLQGLLKVIAVPASSTALPWSS
jgi:hypothetical protein